MNGRFSDTFLEPIGNTNCSRQPDGRLRKSSPRVRLEEFEALKLAQELGVPAPTPYEFSADSRTILMNFVEGDCLEDIWPIMSDVDKESLARQLRRVVSLMRSARQERFHIGAINGPARDCRRYDDYTGGPFTDETAFNAFILDLFSLCPNPIRNGLSARMRSNHSIRFTHGDLSPRNIIVRNGMIQAIVDWEFAGWYPEHYEYVKFFECKTSCKDWKNFAPLIFEMAYEDELVTQQAILRWQRP